MKITVLMVDGGFRESTHAARTFSQQDFPDHEFEVLWIEHFDNIHREIAGLPKVQGHALGRQGIYHSSYCFNEGIKLAKGEVIVIPDADLIVAPDFLLRVWELHQRYDRLAVYGYRYDEMSAGSLQSFDLSELQAKCALKNPMNYGGCLTVRKQWLEEINGYEQHPLFQSGNHANGLDIAVRFKNLGLAIQWEPSLKLYHPWHPSTLMHTDEHRSQERLIHWRRLTRQFAALNGIDPGRNVPIPQEAERICQQEFLRLREASENAGQPASPGSSTQPLPTQPSSAQPLSTQSAAPENTTRRKSTGAPPTPLSASPIGESLQAFLEEASKITNNDVESAGRGPQ